MSSEPNRVPLTLKVPPDLVAQLERLAEDLDVSRSEAGYRALRYGLAEMQGVLDSTLGRAVLRLSEVFADPDSAKELKRIRKVLNVKGTRKEAKGAQHA